MVKFLACGVFRREYTLLPESLKNRMEALFLDSMLHMDPARLDTHLEQVLVCGGNAGTVLAYGDCSPHLLDFADKLRVVRTRGDNCLELWLGKERYHRLRREGVFLLMPEWTLRWKELLVECMGLKNSALARDFFGQTMGRAVYIDTGVMEFPDQALREFSEYTGLETTTERVGNEHFIAAITAALEELDAKLE